MALPGSNAYIGGEADDDIHGYAHAHAADMHADYHALALDSGYAGGMTAWT